MVWYYCMVQYVTIWNGSVWHGIAQYCMVWLWGMVWYCMAWYSGNDVYYGVWYSMLFYGTLWYVIWCDNDDDFLSCSVTLGRDDLCQRLCTVRWTLVKVGKLPGVVRFIRQSMSAKDPLMRWEPIRPTYNKLTLKQNRQTPHTVSRTVYLWTLCMNCMLYSEHVDLVGMWSVRAIGIWLVCGRYNTSFPWEARHFLFFFPLWNSRNQKIRHPPGLTGQESFDCSWKYPQCVTHVTHSVSWLCFRSWWLLVNQSLWSRGTSMWWRQMSSSQFSDTRGLGKPWAVAVCPARRRGAVPHWTRLAWSLGWMLSLWKNQEIVLMENPSRSVRMVGSCLVMGHVPTHPFPVASPDPNPTLTQTVDLSQGRVGTWPATEPVFF